MGQSVSKRLVPMLEKLRFKHEQALLNDALQEIERRKAEALARIPKSSISKTIYTDPSSRLAGFQRGQQYQRISDEDFEKHILSGDLEESHRMPPDLVQFLSEIGPAGKKLIPEMSSLRLKDESVEPTSRLPGKYPSVAITAQFQQRAQENDYLVKGPRFLSDDEIVKLLLGKEKVPDDLSSVKSALQHVGIPFIIKDRRNPNQDLDPDLTPFVAGGIHQLHELHALGTQIYPPV